MTEPLTVPSFQSRPIPLEERIASLEARLERQADELAEERAKREALEEATAPLLERSQEPTEGGKDGGGATRT